METEGQMLSGFWKAWKLTPEGEKCLSGQTEGEYLHNRLYRAFMKGAEAQKNISQIAEIEHQAKEDKG